MKRNCCTSAYFTGWIFLLITLDFTLCEMDQQIQPTSQSYPRRSRSTTDTGAAINTVPYYNTYDSVGGMQPNLYERAALAAYLLGPRVYSASDSMLEKYYGGNKLSGTLYGRPTTDVAYYSMLALPSSADDMMRNYSPDDIALLGAYNSDLDRIKRIVGLRKRGGLIDKPSLSITNSLDVLRDRLLLEMSRRKALEGVSRNRDMLCRIGKRSIGAKGRCEPAEEFVNDKLMV